MVLDSLLPEDHHHHQFGGSKHEAHPLDDLFGMVSLHHGEHYRYVYVGPNRGRYEESTRGNFHYVGPCNGHYEKEVLPPDHTGRYCCMCACCIIFFVCLIFFLKAIFEEPPFDCAADYANWQIGWSLAKKEYCCANEGKGCPNGDLVETLPETLPHEPDWLECWLPDLPIGSKFILTVLFMMMLGCCFGVGCLYVWVRYFHTPKPAKTELELVGEINKLLDKANAATKTQIQVCMMWDTNDDLDLHLILPKGGEVSAECPEVNDFKLDVDANGMYFDAKTKLLTKPIENIVWCNDSQEPPAGEYIVCIKVFEKHQHCKEAKVTVVVTVKGKREVFHCRIVPGVVMLKVTSFCYPPRPQPR